MFLVVMAVLRRIKKVPNVRSAQRIVEIKVREPIVHILSSRGDYNPLRFREQQIPSDAEGIYNRINCLRYE